MTGRASVVFEVCELLLLLCCTAVLGQGRDATDRCQQSDAPFGLLFKLLTLRRISKLPAAGNVVAVVATVIVKDVAGDLMRAFRGSHFFQFSQSCRRRTGTLRARNQKTEERTYQQ